MHTNSAKLSHLMLKQARLRDEIDELPENDMQDYRQACCEERHLAECFGNQDLSPTASSLMY